MDEEKEITPPKEMEKPFDWWGSVLWLALIVLLYFLSLGPVWKTWRNAGGTRTDKILAVVYQPWLWAYLNTPLHKPLGMYLHLWVPKDFDKDGNMQGTV